MKTYSNLINGLGAVAMCLFLAASAHAGIFTWSAPVPITTADASLNLSGTVVGAAVFATQEELVTLTNGAVLDFKADGSVAAVTAGSNGTTFGAFTNTTGNANFNTVLTEFNYDGGPKTITLYNLVVGQQYSVQLFAIDQRGGLSSSQVGNFQDPTDASDISANFAMGDSVYFVATFMANASTVNIQENLLNSGNGNINALVVRAIGTNIPPTITSQPQPATIYHGLTANFTVGAIGTGSLSYQWQKGNVGGSLFTNLVNGGNISGATNYSLTINSLASGDTGDYRVVITNSYGSVTSSPAATLTVLSGSPQFSWSAPAPITTADGTLDQTGTIVGAEVFGATETVVTLTNSSTVDFKADGSVAAVTIGGFGTATGAFLADTGNADFNSVLNQFTYDGGPDTIQLYNLGVGQQYTVQLFALDDRAGASQYRQANFQDPNDPYDISTTLAMRDNVYTIGTFTASNSTVTLQENLPIGNGGNINALVVRIQGVVVAPVVIAQPQPVTIDQGLQTTLTVAATGTAPLSYLWQRGVVGSGNFTNVPASSRYFGLTSASLTLSNLAVGDTADYRVVVSNTGGSTNSAAATLTVQAVTPKFVFSAPAGITTADATLNQSGTIVGAAVFGTTPEIVVLTNGTSVDFGTNASVATATGAGIFNTAFGGNTGNANFNAVLTQATYDGGPKTININNLTVGQSYSAQLFVTDTRGGNLSSRRCNFQDPNDSLDFSATFTMGDSDYVIGTFTATSSTMAIQENLLDEGGAGNINAIVVRQLTGLPLAPQITTPPKSTAVFSGKTAQLTVGANGTSLNYQWQSGAVGSGLFANVSNGGNVSGATTAQLTLASATTAADYRVIVSNGSGSVTSSPAATLTIRPTAATLIHRWNFNETSGTTAFDSIGTANGTLINGSGTSVSFNGTGLLVLNNPGLQTTGAGSYVTLPGGLVTSLSAVTFELWYTNSGLNNGNPLVSFGGPINGTTLHGTNFINFFARWSGSTTAFEIQTTAGDSGVVTLGARQQSGTFHWVLIYDPIAGTVSAYLNGSLQASASGITIPLSTVGTSVGYIGLTAWNQVGGNTDPNLPAGTFSGQYGFNSNGNYPYLNANMDEMRIYDGVLNTNAIAATQLLGPNTLLSNTAYLSASYSAGTMTFSWPIVNGAFSLVSSPVLGPNAVWTPVSGTKSVAGSNYQMSVSTTNAAAFFRLSQ